MNDSNSRLPVDEPCVWLLWVPSLRIPFWKKEDTLELNGQAFTLGWAGVDKRIRVEIDRTDRDPLVYDTPTPSDPGQVDLWWTYLLIPLTDPHAELVQALHATALSSRTGERR